MLTWRGSRRIGGPHNWNVPDEVHRARRVLSAQHGRSAEAEIRDIMEQAVKSAATPAARACEPTPPAPRAEIAMRHLSGLKQ
jgi:hypothetical protein